MPSTTPFSQNVAAGMSAAIQKINTDYAALLEDPSNADLFATVKQDVVDYYSIQTGQRGYASLAASVAGQSDYNGYVAVTNIAHYYGDTSYGMNELRVAVGLAQNEWYNITEGGMLDPTAGDTIYIPTISDDDVNHIQVFGKIGLPEEYWSGVSIAAYNANWIGVGATPAELQGVNDQGSLFADLSSSEICHSFGDLATAVMQTNLQTNLFGNGLMFQASTIPEYLSDLNIFSRVAISVANACVSSAGLSSTLGSYGLSFGSFDTQTGTGQLIMNTPAFLTAMGTTIAGDSNGTIGFSFNAGTLTSSTLEDNSGASAILSPDYEAGSLSYIDQNSPGISVDLTYQPDGSGTNVEVTNDAGTVGMYSVSGSPGVENTNDQAGSAVILSQPNQGPSLLIHTSKNGNVSIYSPDQIGVVFGSTLGSLLAEGNSLEAIPISTALGVTLGAVVGIAKSANGADISGELGPALKAVPQEVASMGASRSYS